MTRTPLKQTAKQANASSQHFGGPDATAKRKAAFAKADIVCRYAECGALKYLHSWSSVGYEGPVLTYVDTHAGAGTYSGSDDHPRDGTALSVLKLLLRINESNKLRYCDKRPLFEVVLMEGTPSNFESLCNVVAKVAADHAKEDATRATPASTSAPAPAQTPLVFDSSSSLSARTHSDAMDPSLSVATTTATTERFFELCTSNVVVKVSIYNCDSRDVLHQALTYENVKVKNVLLFVDPFCDGVDMQDLKKFCNRSKFSDIIMYAAVTLVLRFKPAALRGEQPYLSRLKKYLGDEWKNVVLQEDMTNATPQSSRGVHNCSVVCRGLAHQLGLEFHTRIRMKQQGSTYGLVLATANEKAFAALKSACASVSGVVAHEDCFEFGSKYTPADRDTAVAKVATQWLKGFDQGKWLSLADPIAKHPVLSGTNVNTALGLVTAPLHVWRPKPRKTGRKTVACADFRFFEGEFLHPPQCTRHTHALYSPESRTPSSFVRYLDSDHCGTDPREKFVNQQWDQLKKHFTEITTKRAANIQLKNLCRNSDTNVSKAALVVLHNKPEVVWKFVETQKTEQKAKEAREKAKEAREKAKKAKKKAEEKAQKERERKSKRQAGGVQQKLFQYLRVADGE